MTMKEHENRIAGLVNDYNEEFHKEAPNANVLAALEDGLKKAVADAKKDKKDEVYSTLLSFTNPMLEACRVHHYEFPSYIHEKVEGKEVGLKEATKVANINPAELSNLILKDAGLKSCRFEKSGVIKNGHSWEYRAEKLAFMLTYVTIKKLGGGQDAVNEFLSTYNIRKEAAAVEMKELASREAKGETPVSKSQLMKVLQSIVDMLVFDANEKGANRVKVITKDVEYLLSMFEKAGRGVGMVDVLKGSKLKDYIFTVCHMIVTGTPYGVNYAKRKQGLNEWTTSPVRVAVPKSKKVAAAAAAAKTEEEPVVVVESMNRPLTVDAE